MNFQKTIFIISLLATLLIIILTQTTHHTDKGTIQSIQSSNNKIIIKLENNPTELILFDANYINLSKGDIINFQGRRDTYKNKEQIIIDKITCSH